MEDAEIDACKHSQLILDQSSIPFHQEILVFSINCPRIFKSPHDGSEGNGSTCNAGDLGSVSVLGKSPGEGNCYPFQYFCLENSMDRGV